MTEHAVQADFPARPPVERALMRDASCRVRRPRASRAVFPEAALHVDGLAGAAVGWRARAEDPQTCGFLTLGPSSSAVLMTDLGGDSLSPTAFWTAFDRALRGVDSVRPEPDQVASLVGRRLDKATPGGWYATFFFGVYDHLARRLSYVNCGQTPPALLRANGSVGLLHPTGGPLGPAPRPDCATREIDLQPGDRLLGISDGFIRSRVPGGEKLLPKSMVAWAAGLDQRRAPELASAVAQRAADLVALPSRASLDILVALGV